MNFKRKKKTESLPIKCKIENLCVLEMMGEEFAKIKYRLRSIRYEEGDIQTIKAYLDIH